MAFAGLGAPLSHRALVLEATCLGDGDSPGGVGGSWW